MKSMAKRGMIDTIFIFLSDGREIDGRF